MLGDFTTFIRKSFQLWDHLITFPQGFRNSKEVGAKRRLNATSKVNRQTHTHMDKSTYRKHRPMSDYIKVNELEQFLWICLLNNDWHLDIKIDIFGHITTRRWKAQGSSELVSAHCQPEDNSNHAFIGLSWFLLYIMRLYCSYINVTER